MMSSQVWIIMGSASDRDTGALVIAELERLGVTYDLRVASAHRSPEKVLKLAKESEECGVAAIISIAGKAAALPGLLAATCVVPVIGIPVVSSEMAGLDALCSMTQTPKGIPVATMGLGKAGAQNGALLAARIVALSSPEVRQKLQDLSVEMAKSVEDGEAKLLKEMESSS